MDYLQKFEKEGANRVKTLVEQKNELVRTLEIAKKNLGTERATIPNLRGRIEKLKNLSEVSLTDDRSSYAKFKTSMKKLKIELDNATDTCETLQEIIPRKSAALRTVREKISAKLKAFFAECKPKNAEQVRILIDIAATERQSFHDAFQKIFRDAGTSFRSFAVDKELHDAYRAFWVMPKRSRPKQPKPTPKQKPEPTPEQPKTFLTGESTPIEAPEPTPETPEPTPAPEQEQPVETPGLVEVKGGADGY